MKTDFARIEYRNRNQSTSLHFELKASGRDVRQDSLSDFTEFISIKFCPFFSDTTIVSLQRSTFQQPTVFFDDGSCERDALDFRLTSGLDCRSRRCRLQGYPSEKE